MYWTLFSYIQLLSLWFVADYIFQNGYNSISHITHIMQGDFATPPYKSTVYFFNPLNLNEPYDRFDQ